MSCCDCCTTVRSALSKLARRKNSVQPSSPSINGNTCHKEEAVGVNGGPTLIYTNNIALVKEELEEQFRVVDLNKDGYFDADELKKVMKNLGISYSEEEISDMLEHADVNGSGKIEEDDFIKVMSDYLDNEKEESFQVRDLFDFFDTDKDGFISQDELKFAIGEVLQDQISQKEVDTMMRLACKKTGKSKTAMISFRDFQRLLEDVGFTA